LTYQYLVQLTPRSRLFFNLLLTGLDQYVQHNHSSLERRANCEFRKQFRATSKVRAEKKEWVK